MSADTRYELLEKIGTGSFATVYRARDRELGREVAVKQIHEQYRANDQQLDRYWQEAQLLASLQHPNIMTIFDIQRESGWLIMELMQTNLKERMEGRPMDLRALRTTIIHCLRALKYLHARGIVHGDIKPGNLMIDARRRVKIGDFGLARRVSDEEGSLLKGSTKYMAPESVSDEFGEVGPASDLYSLGFSAYELMCGPNFDSLFPGLSSFGRNKQVAWMMWHAAPDRHLPKIDRVLQGVPDDLSMVIQKLCTKDQSERYQSVDEVLADLKAESNSDKKSREDDVEPTEDEVDTKAADRKKRLLLGGSVFFASLLICLFFVLFPSTPPPVQKPAIFEIRTVSASDRTLLVVSVDGRREPKELRVMKKAHISLQEDIRKPKNCLLKELQQGDRVEVEYAAGGSNIVKKIIASRPYSESGQVMSLKMGKGGSTLVVAVDDGEPLTVQIPKKTLQVVLNLDNKRLEELNKISDITVRRRKRAKLIKSHLMSINGLRAGKDRVVVYHLPQPGGKRGRVAQGVLFVYRVVKLSGRITEVDTDKRMLTIATGDDRRISLPVKKDCRISLDDKGVNSDDQLLKALRAGDVVDIEHDMACRSIQAIRGAVKIRGMIANVSESESQIILSVGSTGSETIVVTGATRIRIGSDKVSLGELRNADLLDAYVKDENGVKTAIVILANRPARTSRRAVLIGMRSFENSLIEEVPYAKDNIDLLSKTLSERYAIDDKRSNRLRVLEGSSRDTMKKEIEETLAASGGGTEVIIYLSTHAFEKGNDIYCAGRKFDPKKMAATGLSLKWLLGALEKCQAERKILLLDCCHTWKSAMPATPPVVNSTVLQFVEPLVKTTTVIVGCSGNERGVMSADKIRGAFGLALGEAYRGAADKDRDLIITIDELFLDLEQRLPAMTLPDGATMTPARVPQVLAP